MNIAIYIDDELVFEEEYEYEDEEGVEYDEDGVAWWFDEDDAIWYYFDEDEDSWVELEDYEDEELH